MSDGTTFTLSQGALADAVAVRMTTSLLGDGPFMDRLLRLLQVDMRLGVTERLGAKADEFEADFVRTVKAHAVAMVSRTRDRIEGRSLVAEQAWMMGATRILQGLSEDAICKVLASVIQERAGPALGELTRKAVERLGASLLAPGSNNTAQGAPLTCVVCNGVVDYDDAVHVGGNPEPETGECPPGSGPAHRACRENDAAHAALTALVGPAWADRDLATRIRTAVWVAGRLTETSMSPSVAISYGVDPDLLAAHDAAHHARQALNQARQDLDRVTSERDSANRKAAESGDDWGERAEMDAQITAAHTALDDLSVAASTDLATRIRTAGNMNARLQVERDKAWARVGDLEAKLARSAGHRAADLDVLWEDKLTELWKLVGVETRVAGVHTWTELARRLQEAVTSRVVKVVDSQGPEVQWLAEKEAAHDVLTAAGGPPVGLVGGLADRIRLTIWARGNSAAGPAVEAKPVEAKPVEAKPVEAKPAEG